MEEFSVSNYVDAAHRLIRQIRARAGVRCCSWAARRCTSRPCCAAFTRARRPIGSFRQQVEEEARRVGIEALHERLGQVDPLSAEKLHKNDIRRIIRALEVYKITGQPISHQQLQFEEGTPARAVPRFRAGMARVTLHHRIDARVEWMFEAGLVDEVRAAAGPLRHVGTHRGPGGGLPGGDRASAGQLVDRCRMPRRG